MNKRLLFTCLALAVLYFPNQVCAQFNDPRAYENTPVGTNQLELGYAYVHANASIDTSLIITGAQFNLNQGTIDYTRYFGLLHRLMWVEAGVPVLVQSEMEKNIFPLVKIPPLRGGDFQGMRIHRPMLVVPSFALAR